MGIVDVLDLFIQHLHLLFCFQDQPFFQDPEPADNNHVCHKQLRITHFLIGKSIDHRNPYQHEHIGHFFDRDRPGTVPKNAKDREQPQSHTQAQVKLLQRKANEEDHDVDHVVGEQVVLALRMFVIDKSHDNENNGKIDCEARQQLH